MTRLLKPWMILALIFAAGGLAGAALTMAFHGRPDFPGEAQMRHHWMDHLTRRLDLSTDQQAKIGPILDKAGGDIEKMHHDEVDRGQQIMRSAHEQIAQLLNPGQKAEFQKMEEEREREFPNRRGPMGGPHERPDAHEDSPQGGAPATLPPPPPRNDGAPPQ